MIRGASHSFGTYGILAVVAFVSVIFFPWPLTAVLVLVSSFFIPFLPFAVGIFADTIYYSHGIPFFTLYGALAAGVAIFVHQRVS